MRVDHDPGSDQLSQEGSQINIITDKTHAITIITIIHNVHVDGRPKPIINKKKMKLVD